jgi:hypothetical protein
MTTPRKLALCTSPIHSFLKTFKSVSHLFNLGGLKGGDHWKDLGVDGRTTLRWILGK